MNSSTRLNVSIIMIVLSAVYAVMLVKDPSVASAVAIGYVAIIMTGVVLSNVWKKP